MSRSVTFILCASVMVLQAVLASSAAALSSLGSSATAITGTASRALVVGSFGTVECNITLRGTLQSRVAKTSGTTAGAITAASAGNCTSGGMTVLALPWPLTYARFSGTLPNINWVEHFMGGFSFNIVLGSVCAGLFRGDIRARMGNPSGSTAYTRLDTNGGVQDNLAALVSQLTIFCPSSVRLVASWTISPTVTMTLH